VAPPASFFVDQFVHVCVHADVFDVLLVVPGAGVPVDRAFSAGQAGLGGTALRRGFTTRVT
jgi:hypothetical protein